MLAEITFGVAFGIILGFFGIAAIVMIFEAICSSAKRKILNELEKERVQKERERKFEEQERKLEELKEKNDSTESESD